MLACNVVQFAVLVVDVLPDHVIKADGYVACRAVMGQPLILVLLAQPLRLRGCLLALFELRRRLQHVVLCALDLPVVSRAIVAHEPVAVLANMCRLVIALLTHQRGLSRRYLLRFDHSHQIIVERQIRHRRCADGAARRTREAPGPGAPIPV